MFDVAASLMQALGAARIDLEEKAARAARAQTPLGDNRTDAAMAAVAERAIFSEVLLNAVRARLSEIKSVTHG